jgi:hypothetical protein
MKSQFRYPEHQVEDQREEWDFSSLDDAGETEQWAAYLWELDREIARRNGQSPKAPWLKLDDKQHTRVLGLKNLKPPSVKLRGNRVRLKPTPSEAYGFMQQHSGPERPSLLMIDFGWVQYESQLRGMMKLIEELLRDAIGALRDDPPPRKHFKSPSRREIADELRARGLGEDQVKFMIDAIFGRKRTKPLDPMVGLRNLACLRLRRSGLRQKDITGRLIASGLQSASSLRYGPAGSAIMSRACDDAATAIEVRLEYLAPLSRNHISKVIRRLRHKKT